MTTAGLRKPYVTPYAEQTIPLPLRFEWAAEAGGLRLTYADVVSQDWVFGVLWARQGLAPGTKILWHMIHTTLQRRCMMHRMCRVCGHSASDPDDPRRTWWILPAAVPAGDPATWVTAHPPTCMDHLAEALTMCPNLKKSSPAVYTVGDYWPHGVLANLYAPDEHGGVMETEHQVPVTLEEFRKLHQALATQLIVQLNDMRLERIP